MKKIFFVLTVMASLITMTACGGGGGNKSASSEEGYDGVTKLQTETLAKIGKTTSDKVVLESVSTTFEDERYMVFDFSECGPEGTNIYLNYLFFPDKESYDEWQTKEKPNIVGSYEMVSEDRDGLLVVYRHTLGYKKTYEEATKFGKLIK